MKRKTNRVRSDYTATLRPPARCKDASAGRGCVQGIDKVCAKDKSAKGHEFGGGKACGARKVKMEPKSLLKRELQVSGELKEYARRAQKHREKVKRLQQAVALLNRLKEANEDQGKLGQELQSADERLQKAMAGCQSVPNDVRRIADTFVIRDQKGDPRARIEVAVTIE